MRQGTLVRIETDDEGTFGLFTLDDGFSCYIAELPYRDLDGNGMSDPEYSCIDAGTYRVEWTTNENPKHGECYEVRKVKGRTDILIHPGNFVGDRKKGLKCDARGCLLPGRAIMTIAGQKGVSSSKDALQALLIALERAPFELTVRWADGVGPCAQKSPNV